MFGCNSAIAPVKNQQQIYSHYRVLPELQNSFNSIMSILDSEGDVQCSSVVIQNQKGKPLIVMTAAHCVRDLINTVTIGFKELKIKYEAKVIKINQELDLAVLQGTSLQTKSDSFARISNSLPAVGEQILIIGSPNGTEKNISRGILSKILFRKDLNMELYQTDAAIFYGNSGGGMFNQRGELIGIISRVSIWQHGIIPGTGQAVGLPHLKEFVRGIL
jgi:serine protease Do